MALRYVEPCSHAVRQERRRAPLCWLRLALGARFVRRCLDARVRSTSSRRRACRQRFRPPSRHALVCRHAPHRHRHVCRRDRVPAGDRVDRAVAAQAAAVCRRRHGSCSCCAMSDMATQVAASFLAKFTRNACAVVTECSTSSWHVTSRRPRRLWEWPSTTPRMPTSAAPPTLPAEVTFSSQRRAWCRTRCPDRARVKPGMKHASLRPLYASPLGSLDVRSRSRALPHAGMVRRADVCSLRKLAVSGDHRAADVWCAGAAGLNSGAST